MFKNCKTTAQQGNIGYARAIYEFQKRNYIVSVPISEQQKYDLIVDGGNQLSKVQVKTTKQKKGTGYEVSLRTTGKNTKDTTITKRQDKDYDLLFVLTEESRCWLIPSHHIEGRSSIMVGDKYKDFELRD